MLLNDVDTLRLLIVDDLIDDGVDVDGDVVDC